MTAWSPTWKVTIAGVEYKNVTLANLNITSGRTDFYNPNQPSYAYIDIINLNTATIPFEIGDSVRLQVDGVGSYQTIFAGNITDVNIAVSKVGSVSITQNIKIIALGAMQRLLNSYTDGVLTKAFDGTQVQTILNAVSIGAWNTAPAAETWDSVAVDDTWNTYGPYGEIDTPGDFELTARTAAYDTAYNIITGLATSGLGYLYEDNYGRICYADSTHRLQELSSNGYTVFSANKALGSGISSQKRLGDIRNDITITYKANATYNTTDLNSISTYGRKGESILTSLENSADATIQATYYLDSRSVPKYIMNSITFALQNDELTDSERASLLGLAMGGPVQITDLPSNMFGGHFEGFLEGFSFQATYNGLNMTLYISPYIYSVVSQPWQDVAASFDWNGVNATLTWANTVKVN